MENIKIRVKHNDWSEVFDMLVELGAKHNTVKSMYDDVTGWLFVHEGVIWVGVLPHERKECREVTFQELKDMVVLKRNDVGDATHTTTDGVWKFYIGHDTYCYERKNGVIGWHKENSKCYDLKPIEEKEMKEFLVNHDNKWTLQLLDSDTEENSYRVAVPKDATEARLNKSHTINFIRLDGCWMNEKTNGEWFMSMDHSEHKIVWQRSETESLNDQYAEIEKVRQDTIKVTIDELKHRVYKKDVSHLDSIDVYRVLELFNVQSHAVGHAIKKLLCSGGRGAKDEAQDIQEAIDSLIRYQEMKKEDYVLFDS